MVNNDSWWYGEFLKIGLPPNHPTGGITGDWEKKELPTTSSNILTKP